MSAPATPGVILWYRVYAAILAGIYGILFLACMVGLYFAFQAPADFWRQADMPPFFAYGYLAFLIMISLVLGGAFLGGFFLPRKSWVWTYHVILICLGMTSACFIPISVPLLIFWLKDDTKAYFGKI